jgi:hypothetical protein
MLSDNVRAKVDHVLIVETEENSLSHLFSALLYFELPVSDDKGGLFRPTLQGLEKRYRLKV